MRYKVFNLDQHALVTLGLNVEESLLLDWILNFKDGNGMKKKFFEDKQDIGYWIDYGTIVKELPILFKQPTGDMDEKQLKKLERNNKDKVGRMLKGNLSKVLTPKKQVVKGEKGIKGSNVYVVVNRDMIDVLKGNVKPDFSEFIEEEQEIESNDQVQENNDESMFTLDEMKDKIIFMHIEKTLKAAIPGYDLLDTAQKDKMIVERLNNLGWKVRL